MCVCVFPDCMWSTHAWLQLELNRYVRVSNLVRSTHTWFEMKSCAPVKSLCAVNAHLDSTEDVSVRVLKLRAVNAHLVSGCTECVCACFHHCLWSTHTWLQVELNRYARVPNFAR